MSFAEANTPIDMRNDLVNLAHYRADDRTAGPAPDPLIVHLAYVQDCEVYHDGQILAVDADIYRQYAQSRPNDLVNKFGQTYAADSPALLHRKLADVLIDTAIDMRNRYGQFTVVMDTLRTYDSGVYMQQRRPDLVASGLLAKAGTSAHNRALAVDSKLFEPVNALRPSAIVKLSHLTEADEHGHLDDLDMVASNRFYNGAMSDAARRNRVQRIRAWQRASVKNRVPMANLLSEFWDDRVPGSPADMWRVLSCRALCIGADGNPKTNPHIQALKMQLDALAQSATSRQQFAQDAHAALTHTWSACFTPAQHEQLETLLGDGGGSAPACEDFILHEWLETIHDHHLKDAGLPMQAIAST